MSCFLKHIQLTEGTKFHTASPDMHPDREPFVVSVPDPYGHCPAWNITGSCLQEIREQEVETHMQNVMSVLFCSPGTGDF
jgi:hypothetical protein